MSNSQDLKRVLDRKAGILQGDAERVAAQRAKGKQTARERIARLLDDGSFVETGALVSMKGDYAGVVTGYGTVDERPVYVFAQDFTVHGGAMGTLQAEKILRVLDLAQKTGAPVVALCDSAGIRLDEGARAMNAYSQVYRKMAKLSGVCPMIAVVLGPCIGGAAMISRLSDVTVMVKKTASLMVYGAQVLGAVAGKTLTDEAAGGAEAMLAQGAVALTADTEDMALACAVKVLSFLPGCNAEDAPAGEGDDLNRLMAADGTDAAALMADLADNGDVVELYAAYGRELRVAFAHVGERSVGLVVSDASVNDGMLTPEAADKAARFIRLCDCYSLPVISLIDSKGVAVPDPDRQGAVLTSVSRLLYAYAEATAPKISVVTGSALGQSFVAMAGSGSADMTYAWPGANIAALAPEAAVQVLGGRELRESAGDALAARAELEKSYAEAADGIAAAEDSILDDVIDPADTRKVIIASLEMLSSKRESDPPKKHDNLPM